MDPLKSRHELIQEDILEVHHKTAYYNTTNIDIPRLDFAKVYRSTKQTADAGTEHEEDCLKVRCRMQCLTSRETSGMVTSSASAAMKQVAMLKKALVSRRDQTG